MDDQAEQTNSTDAAGESTHLDLAGRTMHLIRRSILERLLLRFQSMKFGFTFIERGTSGGVQNSALEPFDSFTECCTAAEKAVNADPTRTLARIEVVPCEYDEGRCHPQMMSVMKTFRCSPRPT